MANVYIVSAVRTPIGKMGGVLSPLSASDLGAIVIREAVKKSQISVDDISEVLMGCVLQAGLGQNVARQASIKAGLPIKIPATTINNVCGSSLKAVNMAAALIESNQADVVVAGGTESMSQAPYLLKKARFGYRLGDDTLIDSMIYDSLWDAFNNCHMGLTAENISERYGISREEQDAFSVNSQNKCETARKNGMFDDEIIPVKISLKKETLYIKNDEFPRDGVTMESISHLRPAFKDNGTITAANSSGINDGAACVVLVSEKILKKYKLHPLAKFVAGAHVGVDPAVMGIGAAFAAIEVMKKANVTIDEIDLIEANEAFASQSIACSRIGGWDKCLNKVNVNGGAIALGHPVGASGCRILVTLIHELKRRGGGKGLATLCVGGGMGVSTIIEVCYD